MDRVRLLLATLALALPPALAQAPAPPPAATPAAPALPTAGRLLRVAVPAPSLAGNLLGDPDVQPVEIYLPPSYGSSPEQRYPSVYLLHGVGGTSSQWTHGDPTLALHGTMDRLVREGKVPEMIVVMPSAMNRYGGSFYANSPVTGNWEDYIARDLVGHVDANFRTLANAASRGVAGHSMGGLGAIRLSMDHPDVFGAAYAMSPCCLEWGGDLGPENPVWAQVATMGRLDEYLASRKRGEFYPLTALALAAAFSPNPGRPPLLVDMPYVVVDGRVVPNGPALARWEAAEPIGQIASRRAALAGLRGLAIDYGTRDQFAHIPEGARSFSRELAIHGIPHHLELYDGDHRDRVRERLGTRVLPFFAAVLASHPPSPQTAPTRTGS
ncbi:MAG: esterase [Acidobacteria bacterium]|nr:esterase [Acidobacteriota bacterium]